MKLALLQSNPRFGEVEANLDRAEESISSVKADVWLLPELFSTGYSFESMNELQKMAEPIEGGPTVQRMIGWAKRFDCAIAAGLAEESKGRFFNSAVLVSAEGVLSHYRKIHVFNTEKQWFQIGDLPFRVVEYRGARLGLMVCFDWRYPEAAQSLTFLGADVILHPSNLVLPWCPDAMITRALENNVYIATCDRCGTEIRSTGSLSFIGMSQVVEPGGELLGRLGDAPGILEVEINPALARNKQVTPGNHLYDDRRYDLYVREPKLPQ